MYKYVSCNNITFFTKINTKLVFSLLELFQFIISHHHQGFKGIKDKASLVESTSLNKSIEVVDSPKWVWPYLHYHSWPVLGGSLTTPYPPPEVVLSLFSSWTGLSRSAWPSCRYGRGGTLVRKATTTWMNQIYSGGQVSRCHGNWTHPLTAVHQHTLWDSRSPVTKPDLQVSLSFSFPSCLLSSLHPHSTTPTFSLVSLYER